EDLHWLDPASEAALEMLTDRLLAPESGGSRALLLATTRPEYRPAWSARVERLSLAPLAAQDSSTLLDDWLGSGPALVRPALAAPLDRLATAEFLGPAGPPGEHAFRHPLTQEVAYRTQLLDRRRRTHAGVARALLAIHGAVAPTHAALLAHHFEEAGEALEAARWHEHAGRRGARSDPADGVRHCRRVTQLLAALPESPETLVLELTSRIALLEIGRIAGIEERESQGLFEEARAVAERLRDPRGHAFLLTSYGRLCGLAGDVAQYLACAERAAELAEGSDDAALAFEMHAVLAHAQLAVGRLEPARAIAERALAELTRLAGLREAVGRSTAPAF